MNQEPYFQLVRFKRWADSALYEVVGAHFDRLPGEDAAIMLRILDHIHVVDKIFQHHLQGLPHDFKASRSETLPEFSALAQSVRETNGWYASYPATLSSEDFQQPLDFTFVNGTPARMRRGEILLHVCLHGTYHRGNAGLLLHKNGIAPNDDRVTDFLEAA
jgi:uncharacterized damage-inducible protein DinB